MNEQTSKAWVDLGSFRNPEYNPGRGFVMRTIWFYVSLVFFESGWFPFVSFKGQLLRMFGAEIGTGVVIKPQVRIKYPWRLHIGDHAWIGQGVWIDNLADVRIGSHACISQGVYFCTGSHDYSKTSFDLITKEIVVDDGAWVGSQVVLLQGVCIGANALVASGSVVTKDVAPAEIVGGNPVKKIKDRQSPAPK